MDRSEFSDEYQDWLDGAPCGVRGHIFDRALSEVSEARVVAADPGESVREVVCRMNAESVGSVLVMEAGVLRGIFTERDVLTRVVGPGQAPDQLSVGEVMTPCPETLDADAALAAALRTMVLGGFRHIPVVDTRGVPVATVSMRRIIHFVAELFAREVLNAPPVRESWPATAEGA